MNPHETRVRIGKLLDNRCALCFYNNPRRTYCKTCPTYSELRRLGESLLDRQSKGREVDELLSPGRVLSAWDVMRLLELGADRRDIARKLKTTMDGLRRYEELKISPLRAAGSDEWGAL